MPYCHFTRTDTLHRATSALPVACTTKFRKCRQIVWLFIDVLPDRQFQNHLLRVYWPEKSRWWHETSYLNQTRAILDLPPRPGYFDLVPEYLSFFLPSIITMT